MKYTISISQELRVSQSDSFDMDFDSLEDAEKFIGTENYYDLVDELKFENRDSDVESTQARVSLK